MALSAADLTTVNQLIRKQRDRKGQQTVYNIITLNPQQITNTNPNVYGPYMFNTQFNGTPTVVFTGYKNVSQDTSDPGGVPFICTCYIDSFVFKGGAIIGMNIGVLGLTPVPVTVTKYTVAWIAMGKASNYKLETQNSSYTSSYNNGAGSSTSMTSDAQTSALQTQ
jgi:hypothetical protein